MSLESTALALYDQVKYDWSKDITNPPSNSLAEFDRILNQLEVYRCLEQPLHPIHRLPPELLVSVFEHATQGRSTTPFILLLVCKSWEQLALNTPTLWGEIIFDEEMPDCLENAFARVVYSKSSPLSITVKNGRVRMLQSMESILKDHWHRIAYFRWSSSRPIPQAQPALQPFLAQMGNLVALGLDYIEPDLSSFIRQYPRIRDVSVSVSSTFELNELLRAMTTSRELKSIRLLTGRNFIETQPIDTSLLLSLPIRSLLISSNVYMNGTFDLSPWLLVSQASKNISTFELHIPIDVKVLDSAQRLSIKASARTNLRTLAISGPKSLPIFDYISTVSHAALTSITLALDKDPVDIKIILRLLADLRSLEFLQWIGLLHNQSSYTFEQEVIAVFENLKYLRFEPSDASHVDAFSIIYAPVLESILINEGPWNAKPIIIDHHLTSQRLLALFEGSNSLCKLRISAIELPGWPEITLPSINKVSFSASTLKPWNFRVPSQNPLDLTVTFTGYISLSPHNLPVQLFSFVDTLQLTIKAIKSHRNTPYISNFSEILPLLPRLRVLYLPDDSGGTPHIDTLCLAILRDQEICANLESVYSPQYADWNILLRTIMSRNILRTITPTSTGPTRLTLISFPRQLHVDIFTPIQRALAGHFVGEIQPWTLPKDM
ncbi:hypothetical protein CPB86DRAFT_875648, partial [Serendipita vermifera]